MFGKASGFAANIDLSTLDGTHRLQAHGAAADDSGRSVAAAGDVNGDGFADLIVGAPTTVRTVPAPGRATWCSARPRALPPPSISLEPRRHHGFELNGVAADDRSGSSVAAAGDVNGDGFADLIVGARWPSARQHPARAT